MPTFDVYGGAGSPFGGPTASWADLLGQHNPYTRPEMKDRESDAWFEREDEDNQGRAALGFYASQPGLSHPFMNWLTNPGVHTQLWQDYLGRRPGRPEYAFQDYLAEFDPRLRWMNQSPEQRGETPQTAYALPSRLTVRQ